MSLENQTKDIILYLFYSDSLTFTANWLAVKYCLSGFIRTTEFEFVQMNLAALLNAPGTQSCSYD